MKFYKLVFLFCAYSCNRIDKGLTSEDSEQKESVPLKVFNTCTCTEMNSCFNLDSIKQLYQHYVSSTFGSTELSSMLKIADSNVLGCYVVSSLDSNFISNCEKYRVSEIAAWAYVTIPKKIQKWNYINDYERLILMIIRSPEFNICGFSVGEQLDSTILKSHSPINSGKLNRALYIEIDTCLYIGLELRDLEIQKILLFNSSHKNFKDVAEELDKLIQFHNF
ncbi:MAG: hypothetical protein GC181_10920 [Bacteroidetes bacterium]|nr:hypothetical protein [Bacteroidota bacterium]